MSSEALIHQAEKAAFGEDYKNYPARLGTDTFLAVHALLKIEKTLEETDLNNQQQSLGEGLFTMLADRFRDAMRRTPSDSPQVEVDINYRELSAIGDMAIVKGNAAMAPYILGINDAFVAAGGRDNKRLRVYFEMLSGK